MLVTLSCDDPFSWTMLTFPFSKTKLLYKNGWNPNSQSRLAGVVPLFPSVKHTALFGTLFNDKNWPGGQQATSPLSAKVREIIAKTPKHVIFIIITHIHRSDQLVKMKVILKLGTRLHAFCAARVFETTGCIQLNVKNAPRRSSAIHTHHISLPSISLRVPILKVCTAAMSNLIWIAS